MCPETQPQGTIAALLHDHVAATQPGESGWLHLEPAIRPAHGVVVGHGTLILHAQNRRQLEATAHRAVRVVAGGRCPREPAVVLGYQPAPQQFIGRGTRRHSGQPQFFYPAILGQAEEPLHPPLRLRTVRQNQLD